MHSFPKKKRILPRKMKKFRFQVISQWLINMYEPCKVADIGGGKGLLSWLLEEAGWDSTVIDPFYQELPSKYRALDKKRVKLSHGEKVERVTKVFSNEMAQEYDLLIGLHTHGCNMQIIDAAKQYGKDFFLIPCCVIDEPIEKDYGINWRNSLVKYAEDQGFTVKKIKFNFKGKNIAIYSDNGLKKKDCEIDPELLLNIVQDDVEPDPDDYYDYLSHHGLNPGPLEEAQKA